MTNRPDEPLTAGNFTSVSWLAGTKQRSIFSACPGVSALRTTFSDPLFSPHSRFEPESGVLQYPSDCVWARQRNPVVALGQLVRNPAFAPVWVRSTHFHHLILYLRRLYLWLVWRMTQWFIQGFIPPCFISQLPVIKCAHRHMRLQTSLFSIPCLFPYLEKQATLLSRRCREIDALFLHIHPDCVNSSFSPIPPSC